jgi:hypothetical protein
MKEVLAAIGKRASQPAAPKAAAAHRLRRFS